MSGSLEDQLAEMSAARAEAERALERLTRLQTMNTALWVVAPRELVRVVIEKGVEALTAEAGTFVRRDGDELETVATSGLPAESVRRFARFSPDLRVASANAIRTRRPQWVESAAEYAAACPDDPDARTSAAACSLPLVIGDRVLGAIAFRFATPHTFAAAERAFMEAFAVQAAQALDRAESQLRETASRRRLEALSVLAQALASALTTTAVANAIVETGRQAADAQTCTLHMYDEASRRLVLVAEQGCSAEVVERIRVVGPDDDNPSYAAVASGIGLWVETAAGYAALMPAIAGMPSATPRARSFWAIPLVTEGRTIGLLGMGFPDERRFPDEERAYVTTFAQHCSDALLRASRLEAERAARSTAETVQASLATTLRSIGDAVIATDAKGLVTMMNPIAERLTSWTEADARRTPLSEIFVIVNEHTRLPVISPVDKVLELGTIVGLANHTILIARDGRETPIDDSGAPIRGPSGEIDGVVLVFRDVSAKKREEARRALLEEASAALAESLDYEATLAKVTRLAVPRFADWCAVNVVEPGERVSKQVAVAHVDPAKVAFAKELGLRYPPPADAPHGLPNVLRTGKSEVYPEITDDMIRAGAIDEEHLRISLDLGLRSAMIIPLVAHGRTLGGLTFVWAESNRRYGDDDRIFAEELASRCASAIDNARLYDAEQQARQAADVANRAKDEFLATVSHELRTPLNAIMGWAKMLSSGALDGSKHERAIATIDRNAVAMAQLIEDLLDISRIISGKMRLEVQALDLGRVVEAAIDSIRLAADAKEISLVESFEANLGMAGDPTRLQQIVWNLLSNAVKFTPKGGRIEVDIVRDDGGLDVVVKDSGKGIDPRFLPHVFDAFRQEDASNTRSRGGLGLGLAITRQLVELHGGRISVKSEGEGLGSTFLVHLPASPVPLNPLMRTGRSRKIRLDNTFHRPERLRGVHALVVDDEEDARILLKTVLEECECRVTTAANVEEALDAIARDVPDVLVSDIGMPLQDGYALIRQVRALAPDRGGNVPAAALTAYARAEDRRRTIDAGFSMHISKPVDPAELVAVVESLTRFARPSEAPR